MNRLSNHRRTLGPHLGHWSCVLALILWVSVLPLTSQESPASQDPQANDAVTASKGAAGAESDIRVRVDVVNVPVAALNSEGLPIYGLKQSDFEIYEDGKRQKITHFLRETDIPLRVGLLLDTSNSARRYLEFEKDAASEFAYMLLQKSRRHQIFLLTFDGTAEVVVDFSNDRDKLEEAIQELKAGGGKALFDSIYFACKEKMVQADNPNGTRRVLVIVSDGLDSQSERNLEEVISMARLAEVVIYAIGTTSYGFTNPGNKILKKLAEETGGEVHFPLMKTLGADMRGYISHGVQFEGTSQNMAISKGQGLYSAARFMQMIDSIGSIRRELEEQYSLAYTPTNPELDGTYRNIQVKVRRKGVRVRFKKGYFAVSEDVRVAMANQDSLIEDGEE